MNSARFPVLVYDRDARQAYKSGGLAAKAKDVANAGRYDDTHIVHVTDDELEMLSKQWGPPSINPHTGMPEFGLFGKLFKVFKAVAPIAVSFIPGIGPVAGAALGAGMGALGGGGLKGALIGGATGALGASGAAGKIGGSILGSGASTAAKAALGNALIGGATGAATGQDPLQSALMAGGTSFLGSQLAGKGMSPRDVAMSADNMAASKTPGFGDFAAKQAAGAAAGQAAAPVVSSGGSFNGTGPLKSFANAPSNTLRFDFSSANLTPEQVKQMAPILERGLNAGNIQPAAAPAATAATTEATSPNWWNRNVGFLGKAGSDLGIKNKHAVLAGGLLAAGLLGGKSKDEAMPSQEAFFGDKFGGNIGAPGNFKLASVSSGVAPESPAAEYAKRYLSGYATGGDVAGAGRSGGTRSFAVQGEGTGREDKIPALLSDGEYVIDAETVALLGDGSSKAGAKALDDFRVKIRKHKGQKLAKGKFSVNAKKPEAYMRGGRL